MHHVGLVGSLTPVLMKGRGAFGVGGQGRRSGCGNSVVRSCSVLGVEGTRRVSRWQMGALGHVTKEGPNVLVE